MISGLAFAQFSGGQGTAASPYQVANVTDLNNVRNYLLSYFIQTADIDLTGNTNWEPIAGGGTAFLFTGNYNGNGKIISNLTITRSGSANVGLFGHLGQGTATDPAVIRNVHLVNVNVSGARGTGSLVGRVTGNIYTLIEACSATGETGKRNVTGDAATGGLVGSNNSVTETPGGANNPIISKCYADIDVLYSGVEAISPLGAEKYGGLAGCNQKGTILDSYARGSVTANKTSTWAVYNVGGLAGCIIYRGVVERSYSTGLVSGTGATSIGGLVGNNSVSGGGNVGTSVNSYWDMQTSGQSTSAVGTGRTTAEMKTQAQFTGFDFTNIWQISPGVNDGYPTLKSVPATTYITWTGNSSNDWTIAENWNLNRTPANHDIVVIPEGCPFYPVVSTALSTIYLPKGISIRTGGNLTINPGGSMTIPSIFLNNEGITGLVINSDASGTGSLIHNSGNLNATVKRYLARYNFVHDQMFHFISSPVAAQAIRQEFVTNTPTPGHDFYKFNEPTNTWINTKTSTDTWNSSFEDNFAIGKGYLVAYPSDVTKNFTGTLNSAEAVLFCTNTAIPGGNGWNLLGNPFPSAIDWTQVTLGNGMDNALYYYDNASANYLYYIHYDGTTIGSGQRYIPAMQGFMVHAKTTGTKTVTLPLTARTHSGQNVFYKSTQTVPGSLSLKVAANGHEDEAFIYFNQNATTAFDGNYDAYKLRSYSDQVPMIYTQGSDGTDLAINGLQELSESTEIHVYLEAATNGPHTITANLLGLPDATVYLMDMQLNKIQSLSVEPVYAFNASIGDQANRFKLFFGSVGIDNPTTGEAVQVYANNGLVYLNGVAAGAGVNITDITGRVVKQARTAGDSLTTVNVSNLPHGMYIVTINAGKEILSRKIIL